ncbi:MAG: hypothetical protein WC603_02115 [Candidatus Paceibacterota bacterium]|jgi:hypothetical protein
MFKIKSLFFSKITSIVTIVALSLVVSIGPNLVNAASLTALKDTLSTESATTVANHTIQFTTPTGVASGQTIILTFDNSTSVPVALDYTDIDLTDDTVDVTLAAAPSGATWGVVRTSSTVITFTNGTTAVAAASVIAIEIGTHATAGVTGDQQITNGSAGTTLLTISGTFTDTGTIGMPIITDSVVVVNALVQPTISFTVSDNTIYFGNLRTAGACFAQGTDPGAVTCPTTSETEAFNLTAGTNATSGYSITVYGPTLTSGANTITAIGGTNSASSPGSEQFGIRLTATGGSGAVSAPYADAGFAYDAAAAPDEIAAATGPSATTTYSARYLANISAVTEAGTYSTSHTLVATATY